MKKSAKIAVTRRNLEKYTGVRRFRFGEAESEDLVGVTTGLAWTEVGGELLTIEAGTLPGEGRGNGTGKAGALMKESVQAGLGLVQRCTPGYRDTPPVLDEKGIHPAGP